ncbi:MAG: baseplate J/gp47 family protein, partial [Candidatus Wildermuthbacteria bacterium]|nr:baseplate J/gp47 family protein [Candidatus Wildermuthbacteria bacterium]
EEKHTLVKVGYEAVVYAERARRANKSGIVVCMGYASSRAYIFRAGRLTDSLPILWGTRELFSPFRDVFGMEERAAKELLSRYEKKEISEALRKKTRELVLSPFSQFATLIREALSGVADYARLSLELIGEGASIPEAQECLPSFKIRVLVPAHARIPRGSRFSSDSSFTLLAMSALYATHKILDITRRKPPAPAQSGGTALSKTPLGGSLALRVAKILLAGALLGALTGGGLWHIFFASSRITLVPKTRSVTARLVFSADQRRADASIADAAIPAMILSKEKEAVRVFPSTGTREKETYAEGVIRVFNTQANKNQILVANTRFIAANGKLFKTTARVTIPPGSLDVRVKAAEPGESYNIEPTAFSLPGLAGTSLYTVIYGKSAEPMRGGSKITATVVTESDIASAELALEDALVKQAKEMIGGSVPEGYLWLPEFTKHAVVESKPLVKAGAELEQFNVSAKVRVSALVFLRQDAVDLLTNALGRLVSDEEELEGSGISASFAGERFRESEGAADIAGTIEGVAARIIDKELLLSRIQGRHKKEAVAALGSYDPLQESGVEISPFWRQTLPADSSRISFTTRLY